MTGTNNASMDNPVTRSLQMASSMLTKSSDTWQNYPALLSKTCEQYMEMTGKYLNYLQQQQNSVIETYSRVMNEMCNSMNNMADSFQDIQVPAMDKAKMPGFMSYFELAKQVEDLSRKLYENTAASLKASAK